MPDKVSTSPSPSLWDRLFGSSPMTPEMEQGIDIAKKENPNLADVQSYGPLSRMLMSNAQGYTSPGRTIYLNPTQLQGFSSQDVADTITHEQQHVTQMRDRGTSALSELYNEARGSNLPYGQRPDEIEAFQAEKNRRTNMGRTQTAMPSFTDAGKFFVPSDIHLPSERKNAGRK